MIELTKPVKRKLRELVHKAHEGALRREVPKLIRHVESWQRGEIDSIALCNHIHEFDNGPVKRINKAFTYANTQLLMEVGYGVALGVLDEQSVPEEVRPQIEVTAAFYRDDS
jgi:hypothetical protein